MRVVHLVRSSAFAGVERYIATTAQAMTACAEVTVIGGHPATMPEAVPGVRWMPGSTFPETVRSLRGAGTIDVLNSHMTDADLIAAVLAPRRTALVSTRHFAAPRGASAPARLAGRLAASRFRAELSVSHYVARCIGVESRVVHTGVAPVPDRASAPEPIVLAVQRLEAEKATEVAVRAWATSGGAERGWRFVVLGDGSRRPQLERLAADLGVGGSVEFRGFASAPAEWYRRAAILIAPTPREGLGLSVLEAMAHEVAVVAADGGGHRETIGATTDARMFVPGDWDAAGGHLRKLIDDSALRTATARAGRDRQRAQFTTEHQVQATLEVYRQVLR